MSKVITYMAPSQETVSLTLAQKKRFETAGVWPRDGYGQEYCTVSHGPHTGIPTWDTARITALITELRREAN